ncbi:hypothetical protein C2I19_14190, partial [Chromobacterium alticapitis]
QAKVTEYEYDGAGRRVRETVDPAGLKLSTRYAYDAANNVTAKTDATGQTTRYVYDSGDRLRYTVDPLGYVTEQRYDAAGHVTDTIRYAKPISGNLVSSPNAVNGDWSIAASTVTSAQAGFNADGSAILQYDRDSYASGMVAVQPGETYSFDLDAIRGGTDDGKTPAPFGIGFQYSADGVHYQDNWDMVVQTDPAQAGAQHLHATRVIPPGVKGVRVWLQIAAGWGQTNRWYTRNVEVRRVGDASPASLPGALDEAAIAQRLLRTAQDQASHILYDAAGRPACSVDAAGYVTEQRYDAAGNVTDTIRYAKKLADMGLSVDALQASLGVNQLQNQLFASPAAGQVAGWGYGGWRADAEVGVNHNADWTLASGLAGDNTVYLHQTGRDPQDAYQELTQSVPVQAGHRYAFSVYTGAHRATTQLYIVWFDAAGKCVGATTTTADSQNQAEQTGGPNLSGYKRCVADGVAPAGAVRGVATLRKCNTNANNDDSWLFAAHAQFEELSLGAKGPSAWQGQLIADSQDQHSRTIYDAAGRAILSVDAAGYVTERKYDASGHVTDTVRYAKSITRNLVSSPNTVNSDWAGSAQSVAASGFPGGGGAILQNDRDSYASGMVAVQPGETYSFDLDAIRGGTDDGKTPAPFGIGFQYSADGIHYQDNWDMVVQTDPAQAGAQHLHATRVIPPGVKGVRVWLQIAAGWGQTNRWYLRNVEVRRAGDDKQMSLPGAQDEAAIRQRLLVSAQDQTSHTAYDAAGRPTFSVDAAGFVSERKYDAAGHVMATVRYAKAQAGLAQLDDAGVRRTLQTDVADQTTATVYDAAGRPTFSVDAQGYVTQRRYDAAGNVTDTIRYAKPISGNLVSSPNAVNADWSIAASTVTSAQAGFNADGSAILQYDRDSYASGMVAVQPGETYSFDLDAIRGGTDDGKTPAPFGIGFQYSADGVHYQDNWDMVVQTDPAQAGAQHLHATRVIPPGVKGVRVWLQIAAGWGQTNRWYARNVEVRKQGDAGAANPSGVWDEAAIRQRLLVSAQDQASHNSYDLAGHLLAVSQGDGSGMHQVASYTLDAFGNRVQEQDGRGNVTAREFDALGRVRKETHGEGDATVTDYDAFGNAVKITDPRGNAGYFYFDALGRRILQVDPEGSVTRTDYDAFGNAHLVTRYANAIDPAQVAAGAPPAIVADTGRDAVTQIEHDALGRQTRITDAENGVEAMEYDAFGNKVKYTNQLGAVFRYAYDGAGHVLKETGRDGDHDDSAVLSTKRFEYDGFGNRTLQVEADGQPEQRSTRYGYDSQNRLLSQTGDTVHTYTLTGPDLKPVEADVAPTETRRYDAAGNLVEFIDANGNVTRTAYDSQNRKIRERNGDGYVTTWAYDGNGNVSEQRVYATAAGLPADGSAPTPTASADDRVTRYEYDKNNRLTKTTVPQQYVALRSSSGDFALPKLDLVTAKFYDANGNAIRETDARGNSVYRWFDRAGRKVLEVDAAGYAAAWTYNSAGKPLRETHYAIALAGVNGQTTLDQARQQLKGSGDDRVSEFDYDKQGRVSEERRLNVKVSADDGLSDGLSTVRTQYHYNHLGEVAQQVDAKGGVTDIDYDVLGRETRRREAAYGADQGGLRPETRTHYNALGQSDKIERGNLSRPSFVSTYGVGGRLLSQMDGEGNVTRYQYDAVGNLTQTLRDRQNPDHSVVTDESRFAYGAAKRQTAKLDVGSGIWLETSYNAWGQITSKHTSLDHSGLPQEFSEYDGAGRLVKGNAGDVTKLYGYDANGNATLMVESGDDNGDSLRNQSLADVLSVIALRAKTPTPLDKLRLTVSDYDARNQHVATYQPIMLNVRDRQTVVPWFSARSQTGSGDIVGVGANGNLRGAADAMPLAVVSGSFGAQANFGSVSIRSINTVDDTAAEVFDPSYRYLTGVNLDLHLPQAPEYGSGRYRVVVNGQSAWVNANGGGSLSIGGWPQESIGTGFNGNFNYTPWGYKIEVYREVPGSKDVLCFSGGGQLSGDQIKTAMTAQSAVAAGSSVVTAQDYMGSWSGGHVQNGSVSVRANSTWIEANENTLKSGQARIERAYLGDVQLDLNLPSAIELGSGDYQVVVNGHAVSVGAGVSNRVLLNVNEYIGTV